MRRLGLLSILLFATACPRTEPPPFAPMVINADAGPRDGAADAGVSCAIVGSCPEGQYCGDEGECLDAPTLCTNTSDCRLEQVCRSNACIDHPRACAADGTCAGELEVCLAVGLCAPGYSTEVPGAQRCLVASDCGPAGVCRNQLCAECGPNDCPGNLLCAFGSCIEQPTCGGDEDCFEGNRCADTGAFCERSTNRCAIDPANDDVFTATLLSEVYFFGASICGDTDFDYYRVDLEPLFGARIIVTSTRSAGTLDVRAIDENGSELENSARLVLPGITVIDVAGSNDKSLAYLEISSLDTSVEYAIDVRYHSIGCAGDARDLYGDSLPGAPVLASTGQTSWVACPDDDDWIAIELRAGDALSAGITWDGASGANLGLEIYDSSGRIATATVSPNALETAVTSARATDERLLVRVFAPTAPTFGAPYTLTLSTIPARRFTACENTPILDVSTVDSLILEGALREAADLGAPDCGSRSVDPLRGDVIYRIVPPEAPSVITASLRQLAGSTSTISMAILDNCAQDLSVAGCAITPHPYRGASISASLADAEPIYLLVSSDGTDDSAFFELEVRADRPALNDTCENAIDLPASTTLNAGNIGATNDVRITAANSCGQNGEATGPDRFYSLTLRGGERAALELSGEAGGFLWVGTDCSMMTATCTTSADIGFSSPARVALTPSSTTTYSIAVDGLSDLNVAPYQLRVIREPELRCLSDDECPPAAGFCDGYVCTTTAANDLCAGAERIELTGDRGRAFGSLGAALHQYQLSCVTSPNQPDVVYVVSVPAGVSRLIARVAEAEFDSGIAIRRAGPQCSSPPDLACNDDEDFPNVVLSTAVLATPGAGDYAIIVDAYEGVGRFTVEVELVR